MVVMPTSLVTIDLLSGYTNCSF